MENNALSQRAAEPRLGPPGAGRLPEGVPMSRARSALLETLRSQPEPVTLAALASATGLHANTLREHLDALVEAGLAERRQAPPSGRGRPAWLYAATGPATHSEYAGLAATLAAAIHRSSTAPWDDAVAAGSDWGRDLARSKGRPERPTAPAARRRVVEILDDLGFGPDPDARANVVRLTHCPLLEAAHRYPDVVCGVHLGIVRGALEEYDVDPSRTALEPFAEPGACRLELLSPRPTEGR